MEVNSPRNIPRQAYEAPTVEVVNVCSEGIICQSGGVGNRNPYNPNDTNPFGN